MGKNIYNRKKGYRYEQKKKKIKRDVISYEDMPLEDYDKQTVEISKSAIKKILISIACILALGLVVFAVSKRDSLTPEKIMRWITYDLLGSTDTGYPVDILGTDVSNGNFIYENGELCYVSDTTYQSFNSTGNEVGYNQIAFANPVLKNSGDNIIIYNLDGYGYMTGKKDFLNPEKETKDKIYTADINSKGDYCLVTKADGYLSKLIAYNKNNEKLYAYSFSQHYINAVAMNNGGDGCIVSGVSSNEGSLETVVYALDFTKETPVLQYSLGENIVLSMDYLTNDISCIVADNASFTLNIKKDELNKIDYKEKNLTSFDIDVDTKRFVVSLSRSGDGRQCSLLYIDTNGDIYKTIKTKRQISSLSLYKNRIAVLENDMCYLYDIEGNVLGKSNTGNGTKTIQLGDVDSVYILGINEIRKIMSIEEK